jgi:hypothetical protein
MTEPSSDTSQRLAAVDPEARDSLVHRTQVNQLLRIGSALGVAVLGAALVLWSTVQTLAVRVDGLAARVTQAEVARESATHDVQLLRDAIADVRADTRVMRTQLELTVRALNADGRNTP